MLRYVPDGVENLVLITGALTTMQFSDRSIHKKSGYRHRSERGILAVRDHRSLQSSIAKQENPPIENALKKGLVIVRSSNVGSGIVARNGEADDDKYGFISGDNLNPKKARILLMLALTRISDVKKIQDYFWMY
jgi:hypothetical protein